MRRALKGQVLILVALLLPLLIAIAGVSISLGYVYFKQTQLQNGTDATALAGAQLAQNGQAVSPAAAYVARDDPGAVGTLQSNPMQQTVTAIGSQTVSGTFLALLGYPTFHLRTRAAAQWGAGPAFAYAVFQGTTNPQIALTFNGQDIITGSVHANDNIVLNGGNTITQAVTAHDTIQVNGRQTQIGSLAAHQPIIPLPRWPMSALARPAQATAAASLIINGNDRTITGNWIVNGPIIINGSGNTIIGSLQSLTTAGITINGNDTTIQGSLFALDGGSIAINGGSTMVTGSIEVQGSGGIAYNGGTTIEGSTILSNSGSASHNIAVNGQVTTGPLLAYGGSIALNGDDVTRTGSGIVVAAFSNSAGAAANITVNGNIAAYGTLYAADGTLTLNGHDTITGAAVARYVTLNGTNSVTWNAQAIRNTPSSGVVLVQ